MTATMQQQKVRFYISPAREGLLLDNIDNVSVLKMLGRLFRKEADADNFMRENSGNNKYIAIFNGDEQTPRSLSLKKQSHDRERIYRRVQ